MFALVDSRPIEGILVCFGIGCDLRSAIVALRFEQSASIPVEFLDRLLPAEVGLRIIVFGDEEYGIVEYGRILSI
jgi:hypothetical protein